MKDLDADLEEMGRDALIAEAIRLRAGIRRHRDCSGHELCWYHPELWQLLPEKPPVAVEVPPREEFIRHCAAYRDSLEKPKEGPRLTSVFGMSEMEQAASRILEKRERLGIPLLCQVTVRWETMTHPGERDGLLNLLRGGWLDPNYWNTSAHGEFFPSEAMVSRLREHLGPEPWLEWRPQGSVADGSVKEQAGEPEDHVDKA